MHLAILMANTDESAFAAQHPRDGEKFGNLLRRARPDWTYEVFAVKDGVFPAQLAFDGLLITGSPASANDGAAWMDRLEHLVRDAVAQEIPLFGACFGHQIIARALGARVVKNPDGWVVGRIETLQQPDNSPLSMYAVHNEQVETLPKGARRVARTDGCEIAGFAIENHVLTTQYHPEMSGPFIAALLAAFEDHIGKGTAQQAARTLDPEPDMTALAGWIAEFFETAQKPHSA